MAGLVVTRRERAAVRLRAGQRVVLIGSVAAAVDHIAFLGQCRLLGQVVVAVQFVDIFGDDHPLGVLPRTMPDAVARVDRRLTVGRLRAEVGMPGMAAGPYRLRQLLADAVGAREPGEVGALAGPRT